MGSDDLTSRWKMSSRGGGNGECVELANTGAVRDSKDPDGPVVQIDLDHFVNVVKTDRLNR